MKHCVIAILVVLAACTSHPQQPPKERDIASYLLGSDERPKNTILDAGDSGPQSLDEYAKNDPVKRRDLAAAGFRSVFFRLFVSPDAISSGKLRPGSVLAISFALSFQDAAGAGKGLDILRAAILREGDKVQTRPAPGFGERSFELAGTLQKGRAPGFVFGWKLRNLVLGFLAVGQRNTVSEQATKELAAVMAAHG